MPGGALGIRPTRTTLGTYLVPAVHEESNVQALKGAVEVLTAFVREHGLRVDAEQDDHLMNNKEESRRGRKRGSTNWSQKRFYREYERVASGMSRPYGRTRMAALLGLAYLTFCKYLDMWGPPPGVAAPGD